MDLTALDSIPDPDEPVEDLDDQDSDEATTPTHRLTPPSQKDWSRIQPIFTDLYIRQGKSLKDVQRLLTRDHAFRATTKMYKNRIKAWKLKKYVKASEKEKIATYIRDNDIKGDTLKKLKFNGRPARLDLVRRYCKKTGAHEEIANALPTKALEDQLTRVADRTAKDEASSLFKLTPSPGSAEKRRRSDSMMTADVTPTRSSTSDPAEAVTWHVQQYFEWHLASVSAKTIADEPVSILANMASFTTDQTEGSAVKADRFLEILFLGLDLLVDQSSTQGWDLIHQACDEAKSLISDQNRAFLRLFITAFTDERWSFLPGLRVELLQFLAKTCTVVLGEEHDLSNILYLLQSEDILQSAAEPILRIISDITTKHRGPADKEVCEIQWSLANLLRNRRHFDRAAKIGHDIYMVCNEQQGSHHESTRGAIRRLADTHLEHSRPAVARSGYREVLKRSTMPTQSHANQSPAVVFDMNTIFALQALCEVDRRRADFKTKELPFEHILCDLLMHLGTSQAQITAFVSTWCETLTLRQRWLGTHKYSDRLLARWALNRS